MSRAWLLALVQSSLPPSCTGLDVQKMGQVGEVPSPLLCVRAGAPSAWALVPCFWASLTNSCSLPAGRLGPGRPAQPPVEVAPSPAPSTASGPMGLASRRLSRRPSVQVCLGSPLARRLATCSAAQPGAWSPGESARSAVALGSRRGASLAGVTRGLCSMPQHAPWRTSPLSLSPVCMMTVQSSVTRPGTSVPGAYAPRAAARAHGGARSSVPLGHPATVEACSCGSLQAWSPVTRSFAIFLPKSPVCRMCTPAPGSTGCLWTLGNLPQIPETSGGYVWSSPPPRVTPEETRVPISCQPQDQPLLCSSPHTSSPCGLAPSFKTADIAPTGAAPMAILHLLGHSGKAALKPFVSRAGTGAALTGCLWLRGPIKLAVQSLMVMTTPGAGQDREQWPPESPRPISPSRVSPVSAGAPNSAVAMTTWLLQQVLLGKAVWASPATHTPCGACCPAPTALAQTGPPVGTSLPPWADVTASGMVAATAIPITLPRRRSA